MVFTSTHELIIIAQCFQLSCVGCNVKRGRGKNFDEFINFSFDIFFVDLDLCTLSSGESIH